MATYNIKLVVTSSNGCKDSLTRTITFTAKPTANFTINKDSQCVNGNSYVFTNTSLLATSSVWNFGDGSATVSTPNASHTYTSAGIYTVKLVNTTIDGCKDSVTQTVTVFAKPTPLFTTIETTNCVNTLTINTINNSVGANRYKWNFGDGSKDTSTNATHIYTLFGNYTIKLVAISNNGCMDSITRIIKYDSLPIATYNISKTTVCFGNSISFTNTSTSITKAIWDFGDGTKDTTVNAIKTYSTSGIFNVKLVTVNANGCRDSITKSVTVISLPTANFAFTGAFKCTNNFTINSINSSLNAINNNWNFGDGSTDTATNPSYTYTTAGMYQIKLIVTGVSSCMDSVTNTVTFTAKPTVSFGINNNSQCLIGNHFIFTNSSTGGVSTVWNFGDGTTDTSINPTKKYLSAGNYSVTLIVTTINGCKDSIAQVVTVSAMPTATYNINNTTQCLSNNGFIFTNTSIGAASVDWNFGDGTIDSTTNATKTYTIVGNYIVKLVITNVSGCKDSIAKTITILAKPTASFSANINNACIDGYTVTLANNSTNAIRYVWDFGDGVSILSNQPNPTNTYTSTGTYIITLVATNTVGCTDSLKRTVNIIGKPIADFAVNGSIQCLANNSFSFNNNSIGINKSYLWDFGDGTTSTAMSPTKTYIAFGSFTVKLTVVNANGCSSVISKIIVVVPNPIAAFSIANFNPCAAVNTVTFNNTSTAAKAYTWDFGDGTTSTLINPTNMYFAPGTYTITLVAANANGCISTKQNNPRLRISLKTLYLASKISNA